MAINRSAEVVAFSGVDRKGAGVSGVTHVNALADLVRSKFRQGWQRLTVTRDGRVVGAIEPVDPLHKRLWWSE